MAEPAKKLETQVVAIKGDDSRTRVLRHAANELVFAVVGHVGSGTSEIARALKGKLEETGLDGGPFEVTILKASDVILEWARDVDEWVPDAKSRDLATPTRMQDLGDSLRKSTGDLAAVATALTSRIRQTRANQRGIEVGDDQPVDPDGNRRAYILDSLRHPAEVGLLRHIYQDAFILVGVVCEEDVRLERIQRKFSNAGNDDCRSYMRRDARADEKHGQRVSDAFHLADFFVDNTVGRYLGDCGNDANPDWTINEELSRLIRIICHSEVIRPTFAESAMHEAYGAQLRSACLSRQVGAALVDSTGGIIASGTNEVPRAGGGVYGEGPEDDLRDGRCALRGNPESRFCSNTREQNNIIGELMDLLPELRLEGDKEKEKRDLLHRLRGTRLGGLLEFSRAVHAEMDALLSAGRQGASVRGSRLFVTTFPCCGWRPVNA